jgi:hypothetical protein
MEGLGERKRRTIADDLKWRVRITVSEFRPLRSGLPYKGLEEYSVQTV